jgi:hypothetical protein
MALGGMRRLCSAGSRREGYLVKREASFVSQVCLVYSVCLVVSQDQTDLKDQIDQMNPRPSRGSCQASESSEF